MAWAPGLVSLLRGCLSAAAEGEEAAAEGPVLVPLGEAVGRLRGGAGGLPALEQEGDPPAYRRLLGQCLVGMPPMEPPRQPPPSPSPPSSFSCSSPGEVAGRVILRACERGTRNVLAFGFALPAEGARPWPALPALCRRRPNRATEELCGSLLWETLLSRVGDALLARLLATCALFLPAPPAACFQLCGPPAHLLPGPARRPLSRHLRGKRRAQRRGPGGGRESAESGPGGGVGRRRAPSPAAAAAAAAASLKRKGPDCGGRRSAKRRRRRAPAPDGGLGERAGGRKEASGGRRRRRRRGEDEPSLPAEGLPPGRDSRARTSGASSAALGPRQAFRAGAEPKATPPDAGTSRGGRGVSPGQEVAAKNTTADQGGESAGEIKMRDLLYSRRPWKERLPPSFVLNRLKGSPAGGRRLVETIFWSDEAPKQPEDPNPPSCRPRKKRLPKRYRPMRDQFQELLRNHAKCPYSALLKKNCPLLLSDKIGGGERFSRAPPGSAEDGPRGVAGGLCPFPETSRISSRIGEHVQLRQGGSEGSTPGDSSGADFLVLLKQYSSPWQVYTFVRECLERVVPAALWGSSRNRRRFYKNVKKFVSLRKLDTFPLREMLWKMRVNDCAWLRLTKERGRSTPASEHHFRTRLLSKFLFWLMDSYVAQLLWSFFYITETAFQKNLLFFFRKAIWSKLQSQAVRSHFAKVHLLALSKEEIKTLQQRKCVPLAAKLRFIPKMNGLRPVVRLNSLVGAEKFCRKNRDKKVQYFNMQLKNLYSVLKYEQKRNPSLLGSSVFGKNDIYAAWKKFVLKVLESNAQMPAFYFVKADVSGAYDTIPHQKVVEVIAQILGPDNKTSYCIRRYAVIVRAKNGQIIKKYRRHVSTSKDFIPDMTLFVHHLQQSTSLRNAIVVEQSVYLKERCSDLFEFFLKLIHSNILKIENRYYVQCCGIPQGSILSTLLCCLCYGDMENKLLCGVQEDGVLMRLTDDFLLVTPHLAEAKTFLRTLATGIPEYGFSINPAKTMMNFPLDETVSIPGWSEFKQLPAHSMFPWCGLLIDTQTLEVYCDYSSYARTSVKASLSFRCSSTAGAHMKNKLFVVLQLQCHCLFLDLQINSLRTVCINIYKIFLLQAYRFHACVLQLPFNQRIKNNPSFFLRIIADTASCGFSVLKTKNAGIFFSAASPSALLTFEALQWLCYHAFSVKLADHRVIYKCLLTPLKYCQRWLLRRIPEATMQLLQNVTEPWLCEDFKAILD